jgi:hypothetical protein
MEWKGVDSIYLDKWRALVNKVMNLRFPYNASNFLTEELFSSQVGSFSMELVIRDDLWSKDVLCGEDALPSVRLSAI